ncbi:MAG: single-stranded DNA-binding protein [Pseudomonadota bacterium]|nr:single-stranded DNA-binding protein [Pseudomonadota bacterium]
MGAEIVARGRLGKDPLTRETRNGKQMTTASLAVTAASVGSEETLWLRLIGFGKQAESLGRYRQGDVVTVTGRLELTDLLERLGFPDVTTVNHLVDAARQYNMHDLADDLRDRRQARKTPHRMDRAGYEPFRNTGQADGRWKICGRNVAVYAKKRLSAAEKVRATEKLNRP